MIDVKVFTELFRKVWLGRRRWWIEEEDAFQTAYLACLDSRVDISHPSYAHYLTNKIRWSLSRQHSKKSWHSVRLSPMADELSAGEAGLVLAPACRSTERDDWIDGPLAEARKVLESDDLLRSRFVLEETFEELAVREGITHQAMSSRQSTKLRRLKQSLRQRFPQCLPQTDTLSPSPTASGSASTDSLSVPKPRRSRASRPEALFSYVY